MTNIILCGGNGTRLWPISRTQMPKQFVKLFDDKSLFQLTVERNKNICEQQFIVSNTQQYFLALDQLEELSDTKERFLLEPIGRNTAPAIALASFALSSDEIVLVCPSDHLIKDELSYSKVLQRAKDLAQDDFLVTFGIKPKFGETGFGYIESDKQDSEMVKAFHEKPDAITAKKYVDEGNYYWNSGIFCFKAGVFLQELKKHSPKIYEASKMAYKNATKEKKSLDLNMIRIKDDDMLQIDEDSIDYAVMEKSDIVKVVASDIGWSDLGSFDALSHELKKDDDGNSINENLISINSSNNFIYGDHRMITLADIDELIIVDTPDALLVTKKGNSQNVKKIVAELKRTKSELPHTHTTSHRPWGSYTILEQNPKYKIKRIVVKPGKRLSLQKHFHRSEHWIVVEGTAVARVGEKEILLRPNESTYIPIGELHRLENPGKVDVVLIEAQVGEYLREDDIVRVEDDFKRV